MRELARRDAVKVIALLPVAVSWDLTLPQIDRATRALADAQHRATQAYVPRFFTRSEWRTVRLLADYVIPRDERSGSATDAKVPEYMDFLLSDKDATEASKVAMRGGLGWLDFECRRRFSASFVQSTDAQRRQVLDEIAYPGRARAELSHGVAFFTRFRDLTGAGFFSSAMGWQDVRYQGNDFHNWQGCPQAALDKLGVGYAVMETRIRPQ